MPQGAEALIETCFPYLDEEQRRWLLHSTGIESGYPALDDATQEPAPTQTGVPTEAPTSEPTSTPTDDATRTPDEDGQDDDRDEDTRGDDQLRPRSCPRRPGFTQSYVAFSQPPLRTVNV